MPDRAVVIHTAARPHHAHLLKNLLEEQGIRAVLLNDALQSAAGEVPFGWTTAVRVTVDESDAVQARELALDFERSLASKPEGAGDMAETKPREEALAEWPLCQSCRRPRTATCPICKTSGNLFAAGEGPQFESALHESADAAGQPAPLFICPTCDEPFAPEYLRYCEWCNYDFGSGAQLPSKAAASAGMELGSRAFVVLAVLVAVIVGLLAWLSTIVPPE